MRNFAGGLLGGLAVLGWLSGCTSDPRTQQIISSTWPFSKQTARANPDFVAAQAANAPGIAAAIEARPDAIAVMLRQTRSDTSGVETMISADGAQLMFDAGMLVGSRGFGNDLMAADVSQSGALVRGLHAGTSTRIMSFIDGNDNVAPRAFKCEITPGDAASVTIGAREVSTRLVTEHCHGELADFFNYYWVLPGNGEIVQSSQWASPLIRSISMRKIAQVRS
ncbi:YjbF family lipoprotein [Rhodobacter lacus]